MVHQKHHKGDFQGHETGASDLVKQTTRLKYGIISLALTSRMPISQGHQKCHVMQTDWLPSLKPSPGKIVNITSGICITLDRTTPA